MLVPLPNPPMPDGPLPEEGELNLLRLKYSILAMICFAFGRVVCAIALGAEAVPFDVIAFLNIFLSIVMGTFLLKDDQHLRGFYKCLAETICQVCADSGPGGMQCLIPFMVMTLVSILLDFIQRMAYLQIMPYGIFLAGSIISHACAVYFIACLIYKQSGPPGEVLEIGGSADYSYECYDKPTKAPIENAAEGHRVGSWYEVIFFDFWCRFFLSWICLLCTFSLMARPWRDFTGITRISRGQWFIDNLWAKLMLDEFCELFWALLVFPCSFPEGGPFQLVS